MGLQPRAWAATLSSIARAARMAWRAFKEDRLPMSPAWWWRAFRLHLLEEREKAGVQMAGPFDKHRLNDSYRRATARAPLPTTTFEPGLPALSIVCIARDPDEIQAVVESLVAQAYPQWELWLTAGDTPASAAADARVKHRRADAATPGSLPPVEHRWIVLLDGSCVVAGGALGEIARAVHDSTADWIYTDNDRVSRDGISEPELKGGFSHELALVDDYATRLAIVSRSCLDRLGHTRRAPGAALHDLLLRAVDAGARVEHLPLVACHRQQAAAQGLSRKHAAASAESLARRQVAASVDTGSGETAPRVRWQSGTLETTIVIPVRDRAGLLKRCVDSLARTVDVTRVPIVIVDDESSDPELLAYLQTLAVSALKCRVMRVPRGGQGFNYARLVNAAIATVDTPLVLQLNNDVQAIEPGWLHQMAGWLAVEHVGVVGARLLTPDGATQHAGVFLRDGREPAHLFTGLRGDDDGYNRLANRVRNVSAVTGACLMTRTDLYRHLHGFDEERFGVQFGDVDYCLKASDAGWRIVYEPAATLYHDAGASRGARYDHGENLAYLAAHGRRREAFHSTRLVPSSLGGPTPLVAWDVPADRA